MDKKLINEDIINIKYLFGYKPGRVISEQDVDYTTDEDLEFEEKETTKSILEKHNLLDEVKLVKDHMIMFDNKSSDVIERFLSIINLFTEVHFLAIVHCEYADFSNVDICSLPQSIFINLTGTDNNLEEQGYECVDTEDAPKYFIP